MDEFLDVLERWLDYKVRLANENKKTKNLSLVNTNGLDQRQRLVCEIEWLNGYSSAFNELRDYVKR